MKKLFAAMFVLSAVTSCQATITTVDPANRYAYGANVGWVDWRGDTFTGAVIGEYVCSGYIYAADVGWISLGSGSPTNGIQYGNVSAGDFGVNQDGLGNLRGYAYGANIGWINFASNGLPKVDLATGRLSGAAWSANCGWVSLSNTFAQVQTDNLAGGATDTNGLPVAWELLHFGHTGVDPNADPDHDGMSNLQEYLAGTDPNDMSDRFIITAIQSTPGGTLASVTWKSAGSRLYYLQKRLSLGASQWLDSGLGVITPDGLATLRTIADTNAPRRFYRVEVVRPLSSPVTVSISATSGVVTAPFTITSNYISQAVQTTVVTNGGRAAYTFTVANTGTYVIQATVNAAGDSANSFFLNMDAEPQDPTMIWDIFPFTSGFETRVVSWRGNGVDTNNQFNPKIFNLSSGSHQLIIRGREANTRLRDMSVFQYP